MKFKEIKDLIEEDTKIIIEGERITKRSNIGWLNQNEYDNYEIDCIATFGIVIKALDKYKNIKEFIKEFKLNGEEVVEFIKASVGKGISILSDHKYIDDPLPARLKIYNANTLKDKIEVLKILYGGNDEA